MLPVTCPSNKKQKSQFDRLFRLRGQKLKFEAQTLHLLFASINSKVASDTNNKTKSVIFDIEKLSKIRSEELKNVKTEISSMENI